jgi:protein involved in polysaccharide export with SLBB domain
VDGVLAVLERAGGYTEEADLSRATIQRRAEFATRDTAFLRLANEHQELLTDEERAYVKLRAKERDAVSAEISAGTDIALYDGDEIVIPRRFPSISVQGEVRSPGLVAYQAGRRVDDYVRAAGGYTDRAKKGSARVTVARTGQQMKPGEARALNPGDTVWIPAKAPRSGWATFRDVITLAAQVATVYLVIHQATK